jgi:hypothetical protein
MIVNIYYLIVGILSIIFSFTHAVNGQNSLLKYIDSSNFDLTSKTTIFYLWHIVTAENLIFGIVFIIMALYKKQSRVVFTAGLIASVMIARWVVIFGSTLARNINGLSDLLIDSIAILVYVVLTILGMRKKDGYRYD